MASRRYGDPEPDPPPGWFNARARDAAQQAYHDQAVKALETGLLRFTMPYDTLELSAALAMALEPFYLIPKAVVPAPDLEGDNTVVAVNTSLPRTDEMQLPPLTVRQEDMLRLLDQLAMAENRDYTVEQKVEVVEQWLNGLIRYNLEGR